jgi:PadR family transcriptional regulator PadR
VSSFDRASDSGPVRKYYRLTDAGTAELDAFRAQWAPFSRTVDELIGKDSTS